MGPSRKRVDTSEIDGDIIWKYDMIEELEVFPHNLATCSPGRCRRSALCGNEQWRRRRARSHSFPFRAELYRTQ